jgi:hypothetical protein
MTTRKRSAEELILGCKQVSCAWDPDAPIYVTTDRTGRVVWECRIKCARCGSVKIERYKPDGTFERIGSPRYLRTPGWYDSDLKFYWGKARVERFKRGMIAEPQGVRA